MTLRELKAFVLSLPDHLDGCSVLAQEEGGYNYYTFDGLTLTRLPLSPEPVLILGERIGDTGYGTTDVYFCIRM